MVSNIVALTPIRRRCLFLILVILVPCSILNLMSTPEIHEETSLQNSIAELQAKLQHLNAKYLSSQEEINLLTHQLSQLLENSHTLPDLQFLINNGTSNNTSIKLPSIYNFLPHLLDEPNSLRPAFFQGKGRVGASVVLGVPTVKREVQSYLLATLKNLIDSMTTAEAAETIIVVFVAEVRRRKAKYSRNYTR